MQSANSNVQADQQCWQADLVTMWRASEKLMETIRHYASFPATGVSLRQMVQFGERPSPGEKQDLSLNCQRLEYGKIVMLNSSLLQVLSSVHRNFCQKSSQFASLTASRSFGSYLMASVRCPRLGRCRIGMPTHSRYRLTFPCTLYYSD